MKDTNNRTWEPFEVEVTFRDKEAKRSFDETISILEELRQENKKNYVPLEEQRQLLHNSIQCPDGTILVSRHQHGFVEHIQEDGREYFVDGGLAYQRAGFSDEEYKDLSVYTDGDHTLIRERFEWGNNFDKDMNRLPKTVYLKLKDITDGHLAALIEWTKERSSAKIRKVFKDELEFRKTL